MTADHAPLTAEDALALLADRVTPVVGAGHRPLAECLGAVLAEGVVAPRDVPPHDNAAVDGYGVAHADLSPETGTRLPVGGRVAAGHPLGRALTAGEAVRIFTGAPVPSGCDTIVMQEQCRREADGSVVLPAGVTPGANRRRAGEDVVAGAVALHAGHRLRPQDLALAAALGLDRLAVRHPLRVAVFSTGDELCEPGREAPAGHIYDANRHALHGLLAGLGCTVSDLGILPDDADAIREALAAAAGEHDALVTSGGVSVGEEDHVKGAVTALGGLHFWRLAIKPGRAVALGRVGTATFLGLPGNPVAAMVTFLLFARPVLLRLMGVVPKALAVPRYPLPAAFSLEKKAGRREFLRGRLGREADGGMAVERFPADGSGILSSLVWADGLIDLAEDRTRVLAGERVDFLPFAEVL